MEFSREAVPPRSWLCCGTPPDSLHQPCSDAAFVRVNLAFFMLHFHKRCNESFEKREVLSVKQHRT